MGIVTGCLVGVGFFCTYSFFASSGCTGNFFFLACSSLELYYFYDPRSPYICPYPHLIFTILIP